MQQGAFGGNLGLSCHYSENRIVLMYKLLRHIQLHYGIFKYMHMAMNVSADSRCRMTAENQAACSGTKSALQK